MIGLPQHQSPASLRHILQHPSAGLKRCMHHAQLLNNLSAVVLPLLPKPLARHCQIVNWRNGVLIMGTDSAVWATRLRYLKPKIIHRLQRHPALQSIKDIMIRVQPTPPPFRTKRSFRVEMSPATAGMVFRLAGEINSPELSDALQRLALRFLERKPIDNQQDREV